MIDLAQEETKHGLSVIRLVLEYLSFYIKNIFSEDSENTNKHSVGLLKSRPITETEGASISDLRYIDLCQQLVSRCVRALEKYQGSGAAFEAYAYAHNS